MKRVFISVFLLAAAVVYANTPEVSSMDIYPSGAKMFFTVDAGPEVTFRLPATFNIDSIRPVKSGINVDYFRKTIVTSNDSVPDFLQELHRKIKAAEESIALYEGQIKADEDKMRMIMRMIENPSPAQNTAEHAESLTKTYQEAVKGVKVFTIKRNDLAQELSKMRNEYQSKLPPHYGQEIEITIGATGQGKLRIEAFSNAAGWMPSYKLNLVSTTGEVESTLVAQARQNTGLNYSGPVTFYTQNPPSRVYIPSARPLLVDLEPDYEASMSRSFYANQLSEAPMKEEEVIAEDDSMPVIVESLVNFSVSGKANLRGDGSAVSVDLGTQKLKSKLKVVLYRDAGREGHLVSVLENIAEPFLAGTAELSVDNQNSGATSIANHGRGENLEIPFGRMPLVKVNKETNVAVTAGGRFTGGILQDGYILEVVNGSKLKLDVELYDRLPYPVTDKITVDNIKIDPAPTTNEENVLTWKMTLNPAESRKYNISFRVRYPNEKELYYK